MKPMLNYLRAIIMALPLVVSARVAEVNSNQAFWSKVNRCQIVVAQIYAQDKRDKNCGDCSQLKNNFKSVSENARYNYAEVSFMMINAYRCKELLDSLGFSCLPAVVIFVDGRPMGNHLCGMRSAVEINDYIESTLKDILENRICQRQQFDEKEEDARLAAWAYWGPWWGCGSFYGPCYNYGFGWGFANRCGCPFLGGWNCAGNNSAYCCPYR